jgi:hypothetical protein
MLPQIVVDYMDLSLLVQLVLVGSIIMTLWVLWPRKTSDPYGLFHLSLNRQPHDDPRVPPKTEWLNMGFWKVKFLVKTLSVKAVLMTPTYVGRNHPS